MALDYEITDVRVEPAGSAGHFHVVLIGYESPHTPGEPITIPIERAIEKMAFGERFHVTIGDERAEVKAGKCPVCGDEPYLVTDKDQANDQVMLRLPQI